MYRRIVILLCCSITIGYPVATAVTPAKQINDVTLKGIVHSMNEYIAVSQFPWGTVLSLRQGDKLFDGYVLRIEEDRVVFCKQDETPSQQKGQCADGHHEFAVTLYGEKESKGKIEAFQMSSSEKQEADELAATYAYLVISTDRRIPGAMPPICGRYIKDKKLIPTSIERVPSRFLIEKTPYNQYVREYFAYIQDNSRFVDISYHDPVTFPQWEGDDVGFGGFPGYFTITVNLSLHRVIDHYASAM